MGKWKNFLPQKIPYPSLEQEPIIVSRIINGHTSLLRDSAVRINNLKTSPINLTIARRF